MLVPSFTEEAEERKSFTWYNQPYSTPPGAFVSANASMRERWRRLLLLFLPFFKGRNDIWDTPASQPARHKCGFIYVYTGKLAVCNLKWHFFSKRAWLTLLLVYELADLSLAISRREKEGGGKTLSPLLPKNKGFYIRCLKVINQPPTSKKSKTEGDETLKWFKFAGSSLRTGWNFLWRWIE